MSNCGRKYDMILLVSESLQALVLLIAYSIHVAKATAFLATRLVTLPAIGCSWKCSEAVGRLLLHLRLVVVLRGIRCVYGCRPSCRWFGVYMVVGHRPVGLLQVLVTSPCRRCAAEIYNWHYYIHLLQERLLQGSFPTVLDSSLYRTARWGSLHLSFHIMFLYHVT